MLTVITNDGKTSDNPTTHKKAIDAIRSHLADTPIGQLETEDVVGFTLCIETTEGIVVAGDSVDFYQLVGSLEDAKFALLMKMMQERVFGEDTDDE